MDPTETHLARRAATIPAPTTLCFRQARRKRRAPQRPRRAHLRPRPPRPNVQAETGTTQGSQAQTASLPPRSLQSRSSTGHEGARTRETWFPEVSRRVRAHRFILKQTPHSPSAHGGNNLAPIGLFPSNLFLKLNRKSIPIKPQLNGRNSARIWNST